MMRKAMLTFALAVIVLTLAGQSALGAKRELVLAIDTYYDTDEFEAVVAAYEQRNPDVDVKIITTPASEDHYTWLQTMWAAGEKFDISTSHIEPSRAGVFYSKGLVQEFDSYLQKVNPYTGRIWKDDLHPLVLEMGRAGTDHVVGLGIFGAVDCKPVYNKRLFRNYGLEKPKTWADFLAIQGKLKAQGHIPFGIAMHWTFQEWLLANFSDVFLRDFYLGKVDADKDGYLTRKEIALAVDSGLMSLAKNSDCGSRWKALWSLVKDWSQYWWEEFPTNAIGCSDPELRRLFYNGSMAMYWGGIWEQQWYLKDAAEIKGGFEYGWLDFPVIGKETSPYAHGKPINMINLSGGPIVNKRAKNPELAMDFLMYLSSPEPNRRIIYRLSNIPMVKGVPMRPDLADWEPRPDAHTVVWGYGLQIDPQLRDKYGRDLTSYLTGRTSLEQFAREWDENYSAASKRAIEELRLK